ncbi:hypothetical protein DHD05_05635 [Arenibacter sp. N53]|nr:hypothetical protein [Arenibacter sp. N53]
MVVVGEKKGQAVFSACTFPRLGGCREKLERKDFPSGHVKHRRMERMERKGCPTSAFRAWKNNLFFELLGIGLRPFEGAIVKRFIPSVWQLFCSLLNSRTFYPFCPYFS